MARFSHPEHEVFAVFFCMNASGKYMSNFLRILLICMCLPSYGLSESVDYFMSKLKLKQAVGRGLKDPSFRVIQNHFAMSGNLGEIAAKVCFQEILCKQRPIFCNTDKFNISIL